MGVQGSLEVRVRAGIMVTGKAFKRGAIRYLERQLSSEPFSEVKASGFLDRFEYCDTAFEDDNVADTISKYEKEPGRKLKRWNA